LPQSHVFFYSDIRVTQFQWDRKYCRKPTFKVKRDCQGPNMTMNYEWTVAGDEIRFKQSMEGGDRPVWLRSPRHYVGGVKLALQDGKPAMTARSGRYTCRGLPCYCRRRQ
jgi:hypothetical protein